MSPVRNTSGRSSATSRNPRADQGPMPGYFRQSFFDLVIGHAGECLVTEAPVDEPLRERPQRLPLARRETAVTEHLRIGCEELRRRRHVPSESVLQMRDDRAGRRDRELLARDLEDECPEGVERRELVGPGPRTEVRPRVDESGENRIGFPKELARSRIGDGW